jgi:heat-inducible transcriptional repressor
MSLLVPHPDRELNERERTILRTIVQSFILHASPVGSRSLSKQLERDLKLSPATIRNVMADLEDLGYIAHPHTSAGRMPTDKGYRFYVDTLMEWERLSEFDTETMDALARSPRDTLLKDASRMLSTLSHHLAVIRMPHFGESLVRQVDLIRLSTDRVLIVVALDSDIVKTITLETSDLPETASLDDVRRYINERLSGKPLRNLVEIFPEARTEVHDSTGHLVRLFVDSVDRLGTTDRQGSVVLSGVQELVSQPEFEDPGRMRSVIELMENEEVIIHVVDRETQDDGVSVRIGNEMQTEQLEVRRPDP